ncbi:MAG: hypothetical protein ACJA2Q_000079 [Pseudohongiellaceae bacterium]|jgi:hypothetical protein
MTEQTETVESEQKPVKKKASPIGRIIFLVLTAACFGYLYFRLNGAAAREGMSLVEYMTQVFSTVDWVPWLGLMICYSLFYFFIDTLVVTKAMNWFISDIKYKDILPVRASAYIISIFNEQVGKGAMAFYLNKRHQIPGWEVGSVMLFIMFCEVFYLLVWASIGFAVGGDSLPEVFSIMPYIGAGAAVFLIIWILYFQGTILPNNTFREKRVLHAFNKARPWHYMAFFLLRSPALLAAIIVYTIALNLFGVEASFLTLLPFLPVIFFAAAVPTPMRAAAITFWVILFPDNEGQMAAFGFVQHNFFILFNAAIGLIFWRKAQKDLFSD